MSSDVEFTSEEIDDLANDCFMVLDEVDACDEDDDEPLPEEAVATIYENEQFKTSPVNAESYENDENTHFNNSNETVDFAVDDALKSAKQNEEESDKSQYKNEVTESEGVVEEHASETNMKQDESVAVGSSSCVPCNEVIENVTLVPEHLGDEIESPEEENTVKVHPYLDIINTYEITEDQMTVSNIVSPKSLSDTPLYVITSTIQLLKVIQELKNVKEVTVYMQNYVKLYRTVVCLLILSTREADYIVDAIHLKNDMLLLTEIFVNPKIVKVVYEAHNVMAYLQHCFRLYLVNVFDVEQAARISLGGKKPQSLNTLLKTFYSCQKENRVYQIDFRKRPLTNEMKHCARVSSHYLIYLYHHYKDELLKTDKAQYENILRECREVSKILMPNRQTMVLEKMENELKRIQECQLDVLRKLHVWREKTARRLNKSNDLILPKANLIKLAIQLPTYPENVFAITKSLFVKYEVKQIISFIYESKLKFKVHQKRIKSIHPITDSPTDVLNSETLTEQAQKRKMNEQPQTSPNKQMKMNSLFNKQNETESANIKNSGAFLRNKNNRKTVYQNKQKPAGNKFNNEANSVNVSNNEIASKKNRRREWFLANHTKQKSKGNHADKKQGFWRPEPFLQTTTAVFETLKSLQSPAITQNFNKSTPVNKNPRIKNTTRQSPFVQTFTVEPANTNMNPRFNTNSGRVYESSNLRRDDFITPSKILNPTDIPSTGAFQNGFAPVNEDGSFRNRSALPPPPPILPSDLFNFISSGGAFGRGDGEELNILFTSSGERNDFSITGNTSRYFGSNKEEVHRFGEHDQALSVIDRKINTLERKVSKFRRRDRNTNYNFNDGLPRKRY